MPETTLPPKENLLREDTRQRFEVREGGESDRPVLFGRFTPFDVWSEIRSEREGHFLERSVPGAYQASFDRQTPRVTFQHGRDPMMGDQILGVPKVLREDGQGPYYEVPLIEGIPPLVLNGLREGAYGASYRFSVDEEEWVQTPERSDHNPSGLPERTIRAATVHEFGPVSFPQFPEASAGVRSLTDWYAKDNFTDTLATYASEKPGELAGLIERALKAKDAPANGGQPVEETPQPEPDNTIRDITIREGGRHGIDLTNEEEAMPEDTQYPTREDKVGRIAELKAELVRMAGEHNGALSKDEQERWDAADVELREREEAVRAYDQRMARVAELGKEPTQVEDERGTITVIKDHPPRDIYDRSEVYRSARSPQDAALAFRDNALRAIEKTVFPNERANQGEVQTHLEKLLKKADSPDADLAQRVLITGSPIYRRAFAKWAQQLSMDALTNEERTAMAEGAGATGGFAIVYDLDPSIVKTSNGIVNPFRRVCRVVNISGTNEWRGVSAGAVVATYEAEATEAVDRSPTLAQPAFVTKRAQSFIPYSMELEQDWGSFQSEMAGLFQDSKDTLEGTQFATGVGTTVFPQGLTVGATNTATTTTTTVLAVGDIYKTEEALPPRFRPNAQWFASKFFYNKVRQLDTAGGANLWVPDLRQGLANNETGNTGYQLIGYPANEASAMAASLATTTKLAVLGDPSLYVIVERLGIQVNNIPFLFGGTAHYPTGQRGLYALWRNTGRVFDAAGFITLVGA